jgi:hypothetical protein
MAPFGLGNLGIDYRMVESFCQFFSAFEKGRFSFQKSSPIPNFTKLRTLVGG